jgi:hypothetical protein
MTASSRLVWLLPATLLVAGALAQAQPGPGAAAGAASAPRMGMGAGMGAGMGPGRGMAGRFGPDNTPGWTMMTPAERTAHRQHMASLKTQPECTAYMDEHHKLMADRAKERGRAVPAQPRRNPCAGLPAQ